MRPQQLIAGVFESAPVDFAFGANQYFIIIQSVPGLPVVGHGKIVARTDAFQTVDDDRTQQVMIAHFRSLTTPLHLTLIAVSGYGQRQSGNREAYSLLFLGPPQPVLPQRIYSLGHAGMGELKIFLVPIGYQQDGIGYEAVFT